MNDPFAGMNEKKSVIGDAAYRSGMDSNPFGPASPPSLHLQNAQMSYPVGTGAMYATQAAMGANYMPGPVMGYEHGYPGNPGGFAAPMYNQHLHPGQGMLYSQGTMNQPKGIDPFSTQAGHSQTNKFMYAGYADPVHQDQALRNAEPTRPSTLHTQLSSIIVDFDPFSPRDSTPQHPYDTQTQMQNACQTAFPDRIGKRQTQDEERSALAFSPTAFNAVSNTKFSLRGSNAQEADVNGINDDTFMFIERDQTFAGQTLSNLDDPTTGGDDWTKFSNRINDDSSFTSDVAGECGADEYDCTFETGFKLGVLMERVDANEDYDRNQREEVAIVKLVVENGAADRCGVTVGSSVVAINHKSVANETYASILEMIRLSPRPMTVRFKKGTVNRDTTQGSILTRISNGTFSIGNLTSGNAIWTDKYFAFGGARMDVLQLFISRAAYHECVIALYEKRQMHSQIQSFRLCRDHKISPIKSKIYKGYGNLHYFSLSVPSLRFIAAKFASEEYDIIRNLWSNTYEAIERKKRQQWP